ncbi:hypothetical protein K438DRAFT_1786234 [Mycena galopus ATCC 62051]|nr:hypothetical protein K438DRAFT_1786234 [Mycena galopus ATCC 62051]
MAEAPPSYSASGPSEPKAPSPEKQSGSVHTPAIVSISTHSKSTALLRKSKSATVLFDIFRKGRPADDVLRNIVKEDMRLILQPNAGSVAERLALLASCAALRSQNKIIFSALLQEKSSFRVHTALYWVTLRMSPDFGALSAEDRCVLGLLVPQEEITVQLMEGPAQPFIVKFHIPMLRKRMLLNKDIRLDFIARENSQITFGDIGMVILDPRPNAAKPAHAWNHRCWESFDASETHSDGTAERLSEGCRFIRVAHSPVSNHVEPRARHEICWDEHKLERGNETGRNAQWRRTGRGRRSLCKRRTVAGISGTDTPEVGQAHRRVKTGLRRGSAELSTAHRDVIERDGGYGEGRKYISTEMEPRVIRDGRKEQHLDCDAKARETHACNKWCSQVLHARARFGRQSCRKRRA